MARQLVQLQAKGQRWMQQERQRRVHRTGFWVWLHMDQQLTTQLADLLLNDSRQEQQLVARQQASPSCLIQESHRRRTWLEWQQEKQMEVQS
jgi:hypothetical protein